MRTVVGAMPKRVQVRAVMTLCMGVSLHRNELECAALCPVWMSDRPCTGLSAL